MSVSQKNLEIKMARASLKLAAKNSWDKIALEQVAKTAKVSPRQARILFEDKDSLLLCVLNYIDALVIEKMGDMTDSSSMHDRVFDVMMTRVEVLQMNRHGIMSMIRTYRSHPSTTFKFFRPLMASMQHMLQLAKIDKKDSRKKIQQLGLLVIEQLVLLRWETDTSSDLAPTMAFLDSTLRHAEKYAVPLLNVDLFSTRI